MNIMNFGTFVHASFANVCLSLCHAMFNANPCTFWSKMVRYCQHRLMWWPKWDFTMVLGGLGDFQICTPGTRGRDGGVLVGVQSTIHSDLLGGGGVGEGPIHDPWST